MAEVYIPSAPPAQARAQKSRNSSRVIDPDTGEISGPGRQDLAGLMRASRARRFDLLGAIRRIDPTHRTARCAWSRFSKSSQINVVKDRETGRARYSGLMACSTVWTCPVCAAKISERRAAELAQAIGVSRSMGIRVMLLTATVPHLIADGLKTLMDRLAAAWRYFTSDRRSKFLRQAIELVGTIRNIEVTRGENGWHPHFHCLVFYRADINPADIAADWAEHWQHCAVKAGLRRPSDAHGLTIQDGNHAAKYVSKWGLEHEMTKSMAKQARRGGRTPFDIAQDFADGLDVALNAALWREFSEAFHGQRQLFWSKGLKALFRVESKDDQELVEEEDHRPAELVIQLAWPEWRAVRARHRATLLDLAEAAPELIRGWLDGRVAHFERLLSAQTERSGAGAGA